MYTPYEKFAYDTFGEKIDGYIVTAETRAVIVLEASKIPGAPGEVGRMFLAGKDRASIARERNCTLSCVDQHYRRFRAQMRHPKHSRNILGSMRPAGGARE